MLRASPGSALRSFTSRPTNSAAKCCASPADPPFPQNINLQPDWMAVNARSATNCNGLLSVCNAEKTCRCRFRDSISKTVYPVPSLDPLCWQANRDIVPNENVNLS